MLVPEEYIARWGTIESDPPPKVLPNEPQLRAEIVYLDSPRGQAQKLLRPFRSDYALSRP